jgi:aminoglycoside 6'-N-acetyltransferase I
MLSNIRICNLANATPDQLEQTAAMLHLAFRATGTEAWATLAEARLEVAAACAAEPVRINRLAVQPDGRVVGWIGAIHEGYSAAWELHPLVVHPAYQRMGIGRQLLDDLVAHVREQGALTLWLGTDDENQRTSIGGIDLYPDPLHHLQQIQNRADHPLGFYRKHGFVVAGVIPDANGRGKPDLLLVRQVQE